MVEGTGRIYKVQTDKKGTFVMVGVDYGVYQIEITAPDGSHVYSGKKTIGDNNDPSFPEHPECGLVTALTGPSSQGRYQPGSGKENERTAGIDPAGKCPCGQDQ